MASADSAPGNEPTTLDWRGIGWFLAINFGLTWTVEFAVFVIPGVRFGALPPVWSLGVLSGIMLFPAVSAYITRRWITREGFASAGLQVGSWRPYLAIWIAMPILYAAIYLTSWLLGLARIDSELTGFMNQLKAWMEAAGEEKPLPSTTEVMIGLMVGSLFGLPMTCVFTFGEEFGWTGYLTPKLMPLGKWPALLLYGVLWGLWHAPLIWIGLNYPGYPALGILFMCLLMLSVGMTQLALRLRYDSVLLPTFLHACLNLQGYGLWRFLFVDIDPLLGGITGLIALAYIAPLGAVMLCTTNAPRQVLAFHPVTAPHCNHEK